MYTEKKSELLLINSEREKSWWIRYKSKESWESQSWICLKCVPDSVRNKCFYLSIALYSNSSQDAIKLYTPSSCLGNFLHSKNTFNSNLSSYFIFLDWNSISKYLETIASSVMSYTFSWTFSPLLFLEVWCQQKCTVNTMCFFVRASMMSSILFHALLHDYIWNFDVLFFK